jgi:hypothetical protein
MKTIALLAALLAAPLAETAGAAQSPEQQVDALFAKWNRPGMPGAVVEVIRDGKVVLAKGYGMAALERNVPMTPSASFTVGSNSKQFNDKDEFALGSPFGNIKYQCSARDGCTGFTVSNGRVWNLQFTRVALAAPAMHATH